MVLLLKTEKPFSYQTHVPAKPSYKLMMFPQIVSREFPLFFFQKIQICLGRDFAEQSKDLLKRILGRKTPEEQSCDTGVPLSVV